MSLDIPAAASDTSPELLARLKARPKAELHLHLEGSIPPATINLIGRRHGQEELGPDHFAFSDFAQFNEAFKWVRTRLWEAEDFRLAALALGRNLAAQGVVYAEVFFAPYAHLERGVVFEEMMAGLEGGLDQVEEESGLKVNFLLSIPRHFGPAAGEGTVKLLAQHPRPRFLGIDLAGPESLETIGPFAPAFAAAREMGFKAVAHAGEFGPPENIWRTLELLKPDRIGHGLSAAADPRLLDHLAEKGITLEISPTSNLLLKAVPDIKEHPLPKFLEAGVPVVINSDDPAFFQTDLCREYALLHREMGLSLEVLERLMADSFRYSFLGEGEKERLGEGW